MEKSLAGPTGAVGLTQAVPRTPTAVAGMGGVGKTQLAAEYAYRHAHKYHIVWWLRAEREETVTADYAALAEALALPEAKAAEIGLAVAAAKAHLAQSKDWLLILDNAESVDAASRITPQVCPKSPNRLRFPLRFGDVR
jgi:KaiC/GvpD/RAD55 family RecA-like ATPase